MELDEIKKLNIYEKLQLITNEVGFVSKNLEVGYGKSKYNAVGEADVLKAVKEKETQYRVYSYPISREIVETNNKKRYEYNEDKTKIRARQGHSIPVNVELKEATDINKYKPYLYHGTSDKFIEAIQKEGLIPK